MARRKIDWLPIRAEYVKGVTPKNLQAKYGIDARVISVTATRQGWINRNRTMTKAQGAIDKLAIERTVKELTKAQRFQQIAQDDALAKLIHYTENLANPENWKEAANAERALGGVTSRGYTVFGLDQSADSHVHLHFGVPHQPNPVVEHIHSTQVIDVETVKPE